MSPCQHVGPNVIVCGPGKMEVVEREPHGDVRWCFGCRDRVGFEFIVEAPVDRGSWYGPEAAVQCTPKGHVDGDLFPGRERDWSDW